ncbi:hypothetical protein C8R45DRAFT_915077 [Mycena sanguinolenta]|nr:hypothetical protein C8R45DRAFT_915077 [Mycena sanguinolenta]
MEAMGGMGMMGLNRDPRIAGEEGGVGMGMGIGGEEGMDGGAAADMMLNMGMGMMNGGDMGMLGLDGGMGMLGGGMGMMGMGMNMNMGMNMGGLGMMAGMPLPIGMGDVSGSAGGDSEARADTDADAEESDGARAHNNPNTLAPRRRGEDDAQTQQTPRAGVVRLPSPVSTSPGAGPSSASSSSAVYDDEEGDLDEEEGEVVVAVRSSSSSSSSSGTMRRASTVRAPHMRQPVPDPSASGSTSVSATEQGGSASGVGRVNSASRRDRADTARQSAASSSSSISAPLPAAVPRANQHHTPYPGAPRVPPAPTPAVRARRATADAPEPTPILPIPTTAPPTTRAREREERHHHSHAHPTGPYRDEDVLLSLQLLAYLSKYPHVRQAFYKRRNGFHPASALAVAAAKASETPEQPVPKAPEMVRENKTRQSQNGQQLAFLRAFGVSGKDKDKGKAPAGGSSRAASTSAPTPATSALTATATRPGFETNVFSLVERFTFRPSSSETDLPNPPPKLPQEIQYWAGVIMRNACRKDDSRGGIRQCANMLCGRWEEYPREFAKCRRCRKAKYCGKECQSTAWSEGHRFWCSAKEGDDAPDTTVAASSSSASTMVSSVSNATITPDAPDPVPAGAERRDRRERYAVRERERIAAVANAVLGGNANGGTTAADAATVRGFRSAGILGAHPNTVSAVFGGVPAPAPTDNAAAGPSRERTAVAATAPAAPPAESTRTRAMALLRRTANNANPLGAIGSPAPTPQRRDRDRETTNSYATFDTYMAERRRTETSAPAAPSASMAAPAAIPGFPNHLHHPQPQNTADIDRYLASFAVPPRRRVSRTSREGDTALTTTSSNGSGTAEDHDNMVLE